MPIDANGDLEVEGLSLRSLPKVSLHDHLDGGVRPATIIELADAAGIELPHTDPTGLAMWFRTQASAGSLVDYLKTFDVSLSVMQSAENLRRISREFVEDLVRDGRLVSPFGDGASSQRGQFVELSRRGQRNPDALDFVRWLRAEAERAR